MCMVVIAAVERGIMFVMVFRRRVAGVLIVKWTFPVVIKMSKEGYIIKINFHGGHPAYHGVPNSTTDFRKAADGIVERYHADDKESIQSIKLLRSIEIERLYTSRGKHE